MIKLYVFIIAVLTVSNSGRAAERNVLSTAPDQRVAIVEERSASGDRDYYFRQQQSKKKLGFVLPREQRHEISNVAIVASWNARSTKVALVLFDGTKLSALLVFSRADNGTFQPITLAEPDPGTSYRKLTGTTLAQPGDGYSENKIGPWLDEGTVSLISGVAKQTRQPGEYLHLLVTYRAHIVGQRAGLSQLRLHGPLTSAESEHFLQKWSKQYRETHG